MKQFAGVTLANINVNSIDNLGKIHAIFTRNYLDKYLVPAEFGSQFQVMNHINACIKVNGSLPINTEEYLKSIAAFLPANIKLSPDKLYFGEQYKEINKIVSRWHLKAAEQKLNGVYDYVNNYINKYKKVLDPNYVTYLISWQICHYIVTIRYLEHRRPAIKPPKYFGNEKEYNARINDLYLKARQYLTEALQRLKAMPELHNGIVYEKWGLCFYRRKRLIPEIAPQRRPHPGIVSAREFYARF